MLFINFLSGLVEPCIIQGMLCKDYLLPLVSEHLWKCLSVHTSSSGQTFWSTSAVFGCLSRELTQAVFTGRLAHREDEGSQFHSLIHAWGHAPKGERVHHERVQIWRKVSAPKSPAHISAAPGQGNPECLSLKALCSSH